MGAFFFVIRTLVLTFVLIMCLQVRWHGRTLEDHAMTFLTSASIAQPVDEVASGTVVFIRNAWTKINNSIDTNFTNALTKENRPGSRFERFRVKRTKVDETYVPGQSDAGSAEE